MDENQIEDVEVIENEEKEPELTAEQEEQYDKFFRSAIIQKWSYTLREIHNRQRNTKSSIEDLVQEVVEKRSPLSKSIRDFLIGFQVDFIKQLLNDRYGDQYPESDDVESGS